MDFLSNNESLIRLSIFLGIFGLLACVEIKKPRRVLVVSKTKRWFVSWTMVLLNALLSQAMTHFVLAGLAIGAAWDAQHNQIGLFNHLKMSPWIEVPLCIILLDALIYFQHVASHKIPFLWRLHRVHHADRDFDVTTAIRFHPIEIGLSMLLKIGAVYTLGVSPLAIIIFEMMLNGCAMFNHSNIRLTPRFDALLRLILVTPDMHRVHHSIYSEETDSNYGFSLPWWDRLFRTYCAQPKDGHDAMKIGLAPYQDEAPTKLGWSLLLPMKPLEKRNPVKQSPPQNS